MKGSPPKIYSLSEEAITVELGNAIQLDIHRKVIACRELILQHSFQGLIEVVTAYTSLTLFYDPVTVLKSSALPGNTPHQKVHDYLKKLVEDVKDDGHSENTKTISIPVCYDEEFALDLKWMAAHCHLTENEVIQKHLSTEYTVFMIGFTPGFPYMGILPEELDSPRKPTPRTSVPAGAVGIAGRQTGIYPVSTPGGWQIIGRTPVNLFSAANPEPSLLKAGDHVRFERISKDEFNRMIHR